MDELILGHGSPLDGKGLKGEGARIKCKDKGTRVKNAVPQSRKGRSIKTEALRKNDFAPRLLLPAPYPLSLFLVK
jgi:hypothetical protein